MFYTGLFKRIIPFGLTFVAGLFVASFFVSVGLPNPDGWREARRSRNCHEKRQLRMENQELRDTIRTQRHEIDELRRTSQDWDNDATILEAVPPVELDEHKPPQPPRKPKHPHRVEVLR